MIRFFGRLLASLSLVMVATVTLSVVLPQPVEAQRMEIRRIHPELQAVVRQALRAQRNANADGVTVYVTTADCPTDCADRVVGGMCYCSPGAEGCADGQTETTLGGETMCRVRPTTASVGGGGLRQVLTVQTANP